MICSSRCCRVPRPVASLSFRRNWGLIVATAAASFVGIAALGLAASTMSSRRVIEIVPVMARNETGIGQIIAYPAGVPLITAEIVLMPPGETSPWHLHKVPTFAYVLEGEVSVDYGVKGVKTYSVGQSLLEATEWPHMANNPGLVPARILIVFMGAEGIETRTVANAPVASTAVHHSAQ